MSLSDYHRAVHDLLVSSPHIVTFTLSFDQRSPKAAFLHGTIELADGSFLLFKEYLKPIPTSWCH